MRPALPQGPLGGACPEGGLRPSKAARPASGVHPRPLPPSHPPTRWRGALACCRRRPPAMPALLTKRWRRRSSCRSRRAQSRTEARERRSRRRRCTSGLPVALRISSRAARPFAGSRQARRVRAPRRARSSATHLPIPAKTGRGRIGTGVGGRWAGENAAPRRGGARDLLRPGVVALSHCTASSQATWVGVLFSASLPPSLPVVSPSWLRPRHASTRATSGPAVCGRPSLHHWEGRNMASPVPIQALSCRIRACGNRCTHATCGLSRPAPPGKPLDSDGSQAGRAPPIGKGVIGGGVVGWEP